jgi:hypothetical protein
MRLLPRRPEVPLPRASQCGTLALWQFVVQPPALTTRPTYAFRACFYRRSLPLSRKRVASEKRRRQAVPDESVALPVRPGGSGDIAGRRAEKSNENELRRRLTSRESAAALEGRGRGRSPSPQPPPTATMTMGRRRHAATKQRQAPPRLSSANTTNLYGHRGCMHTIKRRRVQRRRLE